VQFMATLRQTDVTLFAVDVIAGIVVVVIAWTRLAIPVTLVTVGGYIAMIGLSCIVGYCLFLLPQILSFWLLNTSAIASITDSFWDFNSMPMGIYTAGVRFVGVFVIPIFFITNFPPLFVLDKMPPAYVIWALVAPLLLLYIVRRAWQKGIRNYNSASS
jgi:ABC-2 type transport system permease protein